MVPNGSPSPSPSASPSPLRRKRRRSASQSPSSGRDNHSSRRKRLRHNDLSVEVCKDFIRSFCRRAETDCKFAHPHSAVTIERDKVMACADSLRNKCFRGRTCRYFHPPPQIQESILKALGMENPKVPTVCQDFLRGKCERKSCRYSHTSIHAALPVLQHYGASVVLPNFPQLRNGDGSIPLCRDFLKNACNRDSCKYAHPNSHPKVCQDFLRGKCERKSCKYSHTSIHATIPVLQHYGASVVLPNFPQLRNGDGSIPLCRDFLNNACNRDSCKYAHPNSHPKVHLQQHHGVSVWLPSSNLPGNDHGTVPVCKDFLKNACSRDSCKYLHFNAPTELQWHGTLVPMVSSSPPRPGTDQDILPVCRDFLKDACQRDSCKYAHPNSQTKVIDNQVEVCRDFRRGLCHRTICCFYHPLASGTEKESRL